MYIVHFNRKVLNAYPISQDAVRYLFWHIPTTGQLDVTFPIILEITGQGMVTVFVRQFLVINQTIKNLRPFCRKQHLELFSGIAFELIGRNQGKLVHSCLP